jgi:SSS family solute:Na+ symporter
VVSIITTLLTPNLMLTLINTTYYGVTQFLPGVLVILFGLRVRPAAIALGIVVGQVLAIILYTKGVDFGGINLGLVCLGVNLATVGVFNTVIRSPRPVHLS